MSDYHEGVWAEMAVISRRMARIEIALTERILRLEAEVAALSKERFGSCPDIPDDATITWSTEGTAGKVIEQIMQR